MSDGQPTILSAEEYRNRQIAEAKSAAAAAALDVAPAGGRYRVGDRIVDANGNEVKEAKPKAARAAKPEPPAGDDGDGAQGDGDGDAKPEGKE